MRTFKNKELLEQLTNNTLQIIDTVKAEFMSLDTSSLKWKPSKKEWSILECLDHMNIAVEHYLEEVDRKLQSNNETIPEDDAGYVSGRMGNYFVKSMTPTATGEIKSKMRTFKRFEQFDISENDPNKTISKFLDYQGRLIELIKRSKSADLGRVRVKSAIGGWLMFKLGDALRFVVGHNQRHIIQAQNVLSRLNAEVVN